jgi:hypothetical protein
MHCGDPNAANASWLPKIPADAQGFDGLFLAPHYQIESGAYAGVEGASEGFHESVGVTKAGCTSFSLASAKAVRVLTAGRAVDTGVLSFESKALAQQSERFDREAEVGVEAMLDEQVLMMARRRTSEREAAEDEAGDGDDDEDGQSSSFPCSSSGDRVVDLVELNTVDAGFLIWIDPGHSSLPPVSDVRPDAIDKADLVTRYLAEQQEISDRAKSASSKKKKGEAAAVVAAVASSSSSSRRPLSKKELKTAEKALEECRSIVSASKKFTSRVSTQMFSTSRLTFAYTGKEDGNTHHLQFRYLLADASF